VNHDGHEVIDGEVVAAPHIIGAEPAGPRPTIRCDTHPEWMDCQLATNTCVPFQASAAATTHGSFRFVDRRRLSYPRLHSTDRPTA
jgi:hypothetical protein